MVVGSSDGDPKDVAEIRHSQSPWKKTPTQSLPECSLMGFDTESWPALAETHNLNFRPKHCCSSSNASPSSAAKLLTPNSPSINSNQGSNGNPTPLKQSGSPHRRFGPKNESNEMPHFAGQVPHQHPLSPHIVYPRGPLRLPSDESLLPMQPFIPVFNHQPRVRGFSNYDNPQRPSFPNDNSRQFINLRPMIRPPFIGPTPGFMTGPVFPGPEMHFVPVSPPPPMQLRSPPIVVNSQTTLHPFDTPQLRSNIVKQIEYYFSEENMVSDHYLKSLMDNEGWVSISSIADFKRIKNMTINIPLILDALQSSKELQINDGKVRNRNGWSKWVQMKSIAREENLIEVSHGSPVLEENGSNAKNSDELTQYDEVKGNFGD